jgi:hypothetical protein
MEEINKAVANSVKTEEGSQFDEWDE